MQEPIILWPLTMNGRLETSNESNAIFTAPFMPDRMTCTAIFLKTICEAWS